MNDRELLELAAKAAGYRFDSTNPFEIAHEHKVGTNWVEWNPLTDDGDALRLAVKLRINILFNGGFHHVGTNRHVFDICCIGDISEIRRAIVRAAAEIGKAMP